MRALAEESQKAGVGAAENLQGQGKQLRDIQQKQMEMKSNLKTTEKNLTLLDRCCCCLLFSYCSFKYIKLRRKPTKKIEKTSENEQPIQKSDKVAVGRENIRPVQKTGNIEQYKYFCYISVVEDARMDEIDENLGEINSLVGNLKGIALEINKELKEQNIIIDQSEGLDASLRKAQGKADAILNK
ncbi:hypothetical protein MXB_5108 [Myxobolus squamalis]|nr:hypothetical protein MXB_5108 [Myxobolus squamalis]